MNNDPSNPNPNEYTITPDTPILRMSDEQRIVLRRQLGDAAYVARLRKELRNVRVRG